MPECGTLVYVRAADWALSQSGLTYMNNSDASYFGADSWKPGPFGEYSGDCIKLDVMAWRKAGITPARGNAIDVYNYYKARGMVKSGIPRYGAMVFYGTTSSNPYGHATIYVGGTTVIGTQGFDKANKPVALYNIDKSPNRLGWVALG